MSQWVSPSPLRAKQAPAHHCKATTPPLSPSQGDAIHADWTQEREENHTVGSQWQLTHSCWCGTSLYTVLCQCQMPTRIILRPHSRSLWHLAQSSCPPLVLPLSWVASVLVLCSQKRIRSTAFRLPFPWPPLDLAITLNCSTYDILNLIAYCDQKTPFFTPAIIICILFQQNLLYLNSSAFSFSVNPSLVSLPPCQIPPFLGFPSKPRLHNTSRHCLTDILALLSWLQEHS